jgi:hypothetical protein
MRENVLDIFLSQFNDGADWGNFYGHVKETIPLNIPKPRGKAVILRLFVDSDHAGDKVNIQSRTDSICRISQQCTFCLVFQATVDHRNICFWSGICSHEDRF